MSDTRQQKIVVIVGPTASGKSDLAVKLAKERGGEIISADSRQVYKGMDIGTGKITEDEMQGVPHYLIDVASSTEDFDVTQYVEHAKRVIDDIVKRGRLPIVVGGTGFWIDALVYGLDFPSVEPNAELRRQLEEQTVEQLHQKLMDMDPDRGVEIDAKNKRRLVRAIEIITATGKPIQKLERKAQYGVEWIGIEMPMERLERRIKKRFMQWMDAGLVDEIKKLHNGGVSYERLEELGLAYKYGAQLLQNKINLTEFIELSITSIRQYAKRQMTWFKRNKEIRWIS